LQNGDASWLQHMREFSHKINSGEFIESDTAILNSMTILGFAVGEANSLPLSPTGVKRAPAIWSSGRASQRAVDASVRIGAAASPHRTFTTAGSPAFATSAS